MGVVLLMAVIAGQAGSVVPAIGPADREEARKLAAADLARDVVSNYELAFMNGEAAPLERHPDPILRWSNPAAGSIYGDVYLWTSAGRPAAVASVYRWYHPHRSQVAELHSLATRPISLSSDGRRFWSPPPGVELRGVDGAPTPAGTPADRLRQMRALAQEFSVELDDTRGGPDAVPRRLRLLTQPVYRYEADGPGGDATDGALFAFVEGTDPEAWLMIEAAPPGRDARWRYGFARMNNDVIRGLHRGNEVWKTERAENALLDPETSPYALFYVTDFPWQDAPGTDPDAPKGD